MKNPDSRIRATKETTMRITTAMKACWLAAILGIACLVPARADAQAEVAPDFYELSNTETTAAQPVRGAVAKADLEGKFSLAYDMNCSGKNLKPGQYRLSVQSEGATRLVTIHGIDGNLNILVREVTSRRGSSQSSLLVRKSGEGHRLEGVYVEGLNAMLYLETNRGNGGMERVPIL
jgi:hypothetical protein